MTQWHERQNGRMNMSKAMAPGEAAADRAKDVADAIEP